MNEFDLIKTYFAAQTTHQPNVIHGIGDDAAIVNLPKDCELAITTDTLVSGVHFPAATSAYNIGHKALAVNLSDLAAMGATPAWVTLALTLPKQDSTWIEQFCQGFFKLAEQYQVQLIGGDLTQGPLSITVQAMGFAPAGKALLRSGAKPGDFIYVTGTLGDAGLGLRVAQDRLQLDQQSSDYLLGRLNRPTPRLAISKEIRELASAAIDISDGLAADLSHILEQSKVGADLNVDLLPISDATAQTLSPADAVQLALTAGDDYELCFTIPPEHQHRLEQIIPSLACRLTCIGTITNETRLNLHYQNGSIYHGKTLGYQHF